MKAEDYFVYMDSDCLAYNHVPFLTIFPALIEDTIIIRYSTNLASGASAGRINSILKEPEIQSELDMQAIFDN